jgi:glycosyltransferase involved in cell wall biosynthesis
MSCSDLAKKVSIIIATYNCDRYIEDAVKSVLHQTYQNWELIVVNDGSTDDTVKVLEPYLERIRYIYQENQGVSAARNRGLKEAKGDFIAFLDADDFFVLPSKLAEQVRCFEEQPSVGIVQSGWQIVDNEGKKLLELGLWDKIPNLDLETWLIENPVLPSAMMFRRDWLERAGGFDPEFSHGEDTELVLRLIRMGCQATWFKKITVAYRQHNSNSSHRTFEQAKSLIRVLDKFFSRGDIPEQIRQIENKVYYHKLVWLAWCFYENGDFKEMVEYLEKALLKSPYKPTTTMRTWPKSFESMSYYKDKKFNTSSFLALPEWQQLVKKILGNQVRREIAQK